MTTYVKFDENNRSIAQSASFVEDWDVVDDSLVGKDLIKEEDGTIRELAEEEKVAEFTAHQNNYFSQQNRGVRNKYLAESDWVVTKALESGTSIPTDWATYRTALRDITSHENWPNLEEADWPTKP
jgi:hypothetical protein